MSKRILTLDIGASTVKLAEFEDRKDKGLVLTKYGMRSLGMEPADEENRILYTETALSELIRELSVKPAPLYVSLSGMNVFSRYVRLPQVSSDKISQVVEYEAQQNIPNLSDVVWDRQILPADDGEMDVLLAAVKQDVVENLSESIHNCGLEVELVDVSAAALYNAYRHSDPDAEGCTMILDMGAKTTTVIFAEAERVWSRSFPMAGNSITQMISHDFSLGFLDAETLKEQVSMVALGGAYEPLKDRQADQVSKCIRGAMTRMHAEITRSINTYRSQQHGSAPQRLLLSGGSSVMTYLDVFLKEKLNLEVEYFNPLAAVDFGPAVDQEALNAEWHLLTEMVGLALRHHGSTPVQLNLLPPSITRERRFRKKQGVLAMSCFLVAGISAVWAWGASAKVAVKQEVKQDLDQQVTELRGWNQKIQSMKTDFDALELELSGMEEVIEGRGRWLMVLEDVIGRLPEGVWITQVAPKKDDERSYLLTGSFFKDEVYEDLQKPDNSPIVAFVDSLKESDFLSDATKFTRSTTNLSEEEGSDPRRSVATFQVELVLEEGVSL